MKIVNLDSGSDYIKKLPVPEKTLGIRAKYHYNRIGKILIASQKLKRIHLMALEVMAVEFEQWEWAVLEIKSRNKKNHGSGYKQTFATGASNISVEVSLKRDAVKTIMQCIKQFGLDPKSEKELVGAVDPNQGDLWQGFQNQKSSL